jgi:Subtilase family
MVLACAGLTLSLGAIATLPHLIQTDHAWADSRRSGDVLRSRGGSTGGDDGQHAGDGGQGDGHHGVVNGGGGGDGQHGDGQHGDGQHGDGQHGDGQHDGQHGDGQHGDGQDDNRSQGGRDPDYGYGGDKSGGQRGRYGAGGDADNKGPPKTVLELIKRLMAPLSKGHVAHGGPLPELGSGEILGVGLSPHAIKKLRELGFTISHSPHHGVTALSAPQGVGLGDARELLRTQLPSDQFGLNYAYRPYRYAAGDKEDAPRPHGVRKASVGGCDSERCYGPSVIGWQPALRTCTKGARIGVIDTSIDLGHPALSGRNVEIGNFLPAGAAPATSGHGTSVLTVLAGSANSGTPGLVPDAHFFAADVYRADETGQPVTDTLSLLKAMDWLGTSKVNVVNMSLSGPDDELLQKAIADLSARGVLFVAAAGNGGPNAPPSYPAAYPQVVAVTAVDKNLRAYMHANHGDYIDVAAPGVDIWTALPNALEGYQSGTSFAAPHVTAILAAVQGRAQNMSKADYLGAIAIRDLGPAGPDRVYGRGLALAPKGCSFENGPGGWVTKVVDAPLPAATSEIIAPASYK